MAFQPNTTPTPNWLFNGEMKKMNETDLKVVLLVTRKTLGWFDPMNGNQRKEQDYISQSQFIEFTGQRSNTSIAKAIQKSIDKGWIIARDKQGVICDTPEKRARRKIWYQLGNVFTSKISGTESKPDEENDKNLVQKMEKSGPENESHLVHKVDSTKETLTKETITKEDTAEQSSAGLINPFIEKFKPVNPSYKRLFANKTQRSALQRLIDEVGADKLGRIIDYLPKTNARPYAPTITTPLQLEEKMGQLMAFVQKERNDKKGIQSL